MADLAAERHANFIRWMRAAGLNPHRMSAETGIPKQSIVSYVNGKTSSMRGEAEAIIARYYGYGVEAIFGESDPEAREISHVTAWRERHGMSIEALAEKSGTTVQIMELVEAGELPLTGKRRMAVAGALNVPLGFLTLDPNDTDNGLIVAAGDVPKARRKGAERVLTALTGTDD